jgi:hypothetical protein
MEGRGRERNRVEAFHFEEILCQFGVSNFSFQYPSASWMTCGDFSLSDCNGVTPIQVYLQCFVDMWRPCVSSEECGMSGTCSDRKWTQVVTSENPFTVIFHDAVSFFLSLLISTPLTCRCDKELVSTAATMTAHSPIHSASRVKTGQ